MAMSNNRVRTPRNGMWGNVKDNHVQEISNAKREDHIQQGEQSNERRSEVEAHDDEYPGHSKNEQSHFSEEEVSEDVESLGGVHCRYFHHASRKVTAVDLIQVEVHIGGFDVVPVKPAVRCWKHRVLVDLRPVHTARPILFTIPIFFPNSLDHLYVQSNSEPISFRYRKLSHMMWTVKKQ